MASSTKSSFANKKFRMAAQERELFARTAVSANMDHSDEEFPLRQPSTFVRAASNDGYYYQKSILKPSGSPPSATKKRVSFTEDPAHGTSSGSSFVSAASEGSFWVIDQELVFDRAHQQASSASQRNSIVNQTQKRPSGEISGVFPTLNQATAKTEHLSIHIGLGLRHGNTLDNYTYNFPAPTTLNRLVRPQEEEFPVLYCSLWQRDGHCPCFNCARYRRTLRQKPIRGKNGNLPRFPPATPPTSYPSPGQVARDNISIRDILVAAGVYTSVSELNYGAQVYELKERQARLRIRQVKALQKASDRHDEKRKQLRESIRRAANSTPAKAKKTNPASTKSTVQGYQAWCDRLFQDANEDEDAIALIDSNMDLIENDLANTNNYDTFVDPKSEHEWDESKRSLLRLHNDRATRRQIDTTIYIDTDQQSEQQTGTTTKITVEKKHKQRILNPFTCLRLLQKQISLEMKHRGILTKLYREHADQEVELFNEYPQLEERFYELVGVPSQASGTSDSRWWISWLGSI